MPNHQDPVANRGPIEASSIPTALTFSPPMAWIHIVSPGSGGLVALAENKTSQTYTGLAGGDILRGPFAGISSMTCAKIRYGDGDPPGTTAAQLGPATSTALGGVELSVAPLSPTAPIAAGSNDPRLLTAECSVALSGTDGSLAEQTVWTAPVACTITAVYIETGSASLAASNTLYDTFTAQKRPLSAPGTPATVASTTTKAANLNGTTAWSDASLGAITNGSFLAGDKLTFKSVATGGGQAAAQGFVRVTYTVP